MAIPDFIPRERPDPDNLEYAALKRQGIALTQDLSGDAWTDYNEHDPGVTILEQLCYGLTDLAYRSGLPVADYLCDGKGNVDYNGQALFPPQDILPSRPVTANDYRKLLYDAIPEIEDIWLRPKRGKGAHANGLYTVYIKLDSLLGAASTQQRKAEVREKVLRIFCANRNLCEDIDEIRIVEVAKYYLSGEIEVKGRASSKVFADIFFQCAKLLSSAIRIERYEDVLAAGVSYDELFNGPLTGHGYIDDAGLQDARKSISSVKLIGLIRQIEGVAQVRKFVLRDEDGNPVEDLPCDPGQSAFPELTFPDTDERKRYLQFAVSGNTRRGGNTPAMLAQEADTRKHNAMLESARLELRKLYFGFRAFRSASDAVDGLVTLPRGMPHDLADYYSVQNQFPAIYGINRYGIPESAPAERKAKGRQLKAYLYPFEQLMANYLQTVDSIGHLFSLEEGLRHSYFSQVLGDAQIPNIESLRNPFVPHEHAVADISAEYDNVDERRSRALDAMLAIYGEEFPADAFFLYNDYRAGAALPWLVEYKLRYLRNLPELGRDRNGAMDYLQDIAEEGNLAGLQKKVGILLGVDDCTSYRSLTGGILRQKILLKPDPEPGDESGHESGDEAGEMPVCDLPPGNRKAAEALSMRNGAIPRSMFTGGVKLENFVLAQRGAQVAVGFRKEPGAPLWHLAYRRDVEQATVFAHQFRNAIALLNRQCEGMHLVEHLLLRPQGPGVIAHDEVGVPGDFYGNCVSVVLPGWTARFSNAGFRKALEETVCRNLAAHIFPEFHWLDFADMHVFEQYQRHWHACLQKRAQGDVDYDGLNAASEKIIVFLLMKRAEGQRNYWV